MISCRSLHTLQDRKFSSFSFATMPALTHMQRSEIVKEYHRCKNFSLTAERFKTNPKTVKLWVERSEAIDDVVSRKKPGRPQKLDDDMCLLAEGMLLDTKQFGTLKSVTRELNEKSGTHVSRWTVSRSVKSFCKKRGHPIHADSSRPQKLLSADTMLKRLQFCKANKNRNWGHVMFTDRCKFHHTYVGGVVKKSSWRRVGDRRVAPRVNHASCFNVYAGITKFGVTTMHVVAGTTSHRSVFINKKGDPAKNITGAEYKHVVSSTFLPQGKRLFTNAGMSTWWLQQDNDPCHKKAAHEALGEWNHQHPEHTVQLLPEWPPNSPDLNPIENLWSYVQEEVEQAGCKDFKSFCDTVQHTFAHIPKRQLNRLFTSMKTRLQICLAKNGDHTGY